MSLWPVAQALLITLAVEVPVIAWLGAPHRRRLAMTCAGITSVTNVAMNLWWFDQVGATISTLAAAEGAAVVIEAGAYLIAVPTRGPMRCLRDSAVANGLSLVVGLAVPLIG
mgnify:CR=1 FL=1